MPAFFFNGQPSGKLIYYKIRLTLGACLPLKNSMTSAYPKTLFDIKRPFAIQKSSILY